MLNEVEKDQKTPELNVVGPNNDLDWQAIVHSMFCRLGPYVGSARQAFTKTGIIFYLEVEF